MRRLPAIECFKHAGSGNCLFNEGENPKIDQKVVSSGIQGDGAASHGLLRRCGGLAA